MWWQRRPTKSTRLGRPPARGTWRRMPIPVLALLVPIAVLVGWAIPLFGITLAAFLAVDAILGFVRHRRAQPDSSHAQP